MKCNNCGYSLQIEDEVCPSCGTPNPFYKEHREEMERYSKEFKETQDAVLDKTQKTAGVMTKFIISLLLIVLSFVILVAAGSSGTSDKRKIRKVRANLEQYRAEYKEVEASGDYIYLDQWFADNYLNKVEEFNDCLNVFNVCMYYKYVAEYVAEVSYPEYMKYAVRDRENYCQSIIESYDQMRHYGEAELNKDTVDEGHIKCVNDCISQTRVLIQGVFGLSEDQMLKFDDVTATERTGMLLENWPYEK